MKVICNKSGIYTKCSECQHGEPHDEVGLRGELDGCTAPGDCHEDGRFREFILVRCIHVPSPNESPNGPTGHGDICMSDADTGL